MEWFIFAILAALLWTVSNIIDKYVISKRLKDPILVFGIFGMIGLVFALAVFLFDFNLFTYSILSFALFSGLIYGLGIFLYYKALVYSEISRIASLLYVSPIFVTLLAFVFLGEVFTLLNYLGIFLLVLGAITISLKNWSIFKLDKSFWIMMLSVFLLSIYMVLVKSLLFENSFHHVFAYVIVGAFVFALLLLIFNIKKFKKLSKSNFKQVVSYLTLSQLFNVGGQFSLFFALSLGTASLVTAVTTVQPLFVLIFATLFTIFMPKVISEEITMSILKKKLISIILIILGTILVI